MKKLILSLSTLAVATSAGVSIVACSTNKTYERTFSSVQDIKVTNSSIWAHQSAETYIEEKDLLALIWPKEQNTEKHNKAKTEKKLKAMAAYDFENAGDAFNSLTSSADPKKEVTIEIHAQKKGTNIVEIDKVEDLKELIKCDKPIYIKFKSNTKYSDLLEIKPVKNKQTIKDDKIDIQVYPAKDAEISSKISKKTNSLAKSTDKEKGKNPVDDYYLKVMQISQDYSTKSKANIQKAAAAFATETSLFLKSYYALDTEWFDDGNYNGQNLRDQIQASIWDDETNFTTFENGMNNFSNYHDYGKTLYAKFDFKVSPTRSLELTFKTVEPKEHLKSLIDQAKEFKEDDYPKKEWEEFKEVLTKAEEVYNHKDSKPNDYIEEANKLNKAIIKLENSKKTKFTDAQKQLKMTDLEKMYWNENNKSAK